MLTKIVSLLMIPILFLQTLFPAMLGERNDKSLNDKDLKSLTSVSDYVSYISENGAPSFSTELFGKVLRPADEIRRMFLGYIYPESNEAYLDTTVEGYLGEMFDYIKDNSGLDIEAIMGHIPTPNTPLELLNKTFNINPSTFRKQLLAMSDERFAAGDTTMSSLLFFLGAYFSVIANIKFYTEAVEGNSEEVEIKLDVTYKDGEKLTLGSGIFINTKTGLFFARDDKGILGLGFNFSVKDLVVYATVHSWQREFGFMLLYDILANSTILFNMATRRYKFDYAGKEWMVQIWKGNYALVTNGAEVGFYNREPGSKGTFYNCASDEELREMTMEVYHRDKLLFSKGPECHWWINGFQLNKVIYTPSELTLKFTIEMPDKEMLNALAKAIDNEYCHDAKYTIDGLKISVEW